MRWFEAADGSIAAWQNDQQKKVTYDLEAQMTGATKVKTASSQSTWWEHLIQ